MVERYLIQFSTDYIKFLNCVVSIITVTTWRSVLLWAGSKYGSTLLGSSGPPLRLGDETVTASNYVRLLGVTISSDLSPVKHVGTISASCFYWQRQIRRIQRSLDAESAKTLVQAFITSRIDGCNTVLAGSPRTITDRLQRLLNAAARVILGSSIEAWHICSSLRCTGSMFSSESSISSEWSKCVKPRLNFPVLLMTRAAAFSKRCYSLFVVSFEFLSRHWPN